MTDVLIIGGGPAGVTAALYTARAGLTTQILYTDYGALAKAECIENFYGQSGLIDGKTLIETGLEQARKVGAEVIEGEVVALASDDFFTAQTAENTYQAKAILLATGASRKSPDISGLLDFEGRGVSYCAVCDGFFYRGKDVIVLGNGAYARQEARELEPLVHSVTLFDPDEVNEIFGDKTVRGIRLKNGEEIPAVGVFVAVGVAGGTDLARTMGVVVNKNGLVVDDNLRTSLPGLWAAGDCVPGIKQIAKAVYDGALAGMEMIKYVRGK